MEFRVAVPNYDVAYIKGEFWSALACHVEFHVDVKKYKYKGIV
jgi:hypothetical protein